MRIHYGSPALKNFVQHYEKSTEFKFLPRACPVIVLLDNDDEAKKMLSLLNDKFKKEGVQYDRHTNFAYHVISNLYVMLLPKPAGTVKNKIEDLFDSSVTAKMLEGKTFSAENGKKFDNQKHYSKQKLATKIVRPTQNTINFKEFRPVLENLSQIINSYKPTK